MISESATEVACQVNFAKMCPLTYELSYVTEYDEKLVFQFKLGFIAYLIATNRDVFRQ